ncbi:hypothetical protein A9Q74_04055 [Colwellia sp. 39_35_sub15_T18]|nr:hypothetical protein A9Q74_04055 [Colwellia sp. 39_35_sub15_T18]
MRMNKQRGVVLIASLVFLIALTAVASALMLNTTADLKMSGASEEKVVANQEVVSAIDELIFAQVNAPTGGNDFAVPLVTFNKTAGNCTDSGDNTLIEIDGECVINALDEFDDVNPDTDVTLATIGMGNNQFALETDCPHSTNASSTEVFTCNVLRIQVNKQYGRKNASLVQVNSGIAQQLLR